MKKIIVLVLCLLLFCILWFVFIFSNRQIKKIENALGVNNLKVSNAKYYYVELSPEFKYPYNTYMFFKIEKSDFIDLTKKIALIKYSDESYIDSLLCLKYPNNYYTKQRFWSFKNGINENFYSKSFNESLPDWWHPSENDNSELYGKYYNDTAKIKTVNCLCDNWSGRILMQYDSVDKSAYILIENIMR
jgi:hypothetical protein